MSEQHHRAARSREWLISRERLKQRADLLDIRFDKERNLDRSLVAELLAGEWIRLADNLLISGAAGTGKTWLD